MGIFLAETLGETNAKILWKDEVEGRGLAIRCTIRGRDTIIIAFHANCSNGDADQAASYTRLKEGIPMIPDADYILMADTNNVKDPSLDSKRSDGGKNNQSHPLGTKALRLPR